MMKGNIFTVTCTGLKAEWTSTIETAAKFPVDPGTVVEVTCSDLGALNKGSNEVTCTAETASILLYNIKRDDIGI